MFIEFELFSIEESCLLNLICGDFLLFCEFCGIVLGKNMISKAKILKINKFKKKNLLQVFVYFSVVINQSTKLKN
jgi:hypothetical protein